MIPLFAVLAVTLHAEPLRPVKVLSGSGLSVHGRYAWSVGDGSVGVWNMDALKQIAVIELPGYARPGGGKDGLSLSPLAISADGRWLVLSAGKTHWDGGFEPSGSSRGSAELLLLSVSEQRVVRRLAQIPTGDCVSIGITTLCPEFESAEFSPDGKNVLYWERTDHSATKTAKSAMDRYYNWSNLVRRWKRRAFVAGLDGRIRSQSPSYEWFSDESQEPAVSGSRPPKPEAGFLADSHAALLTADDAGCQVKTFDGARISFLDDCSGEQKPVFDTGLVNSGSGDFRAWDPASGMLKFKLPIALKNWFEARDSGTTIVASDDLSAVTQTTYVKSSSTAAVTVTDAATGRVLWKGDTETPDQDSNLTYFETHYSRADGRLVIQSMEDATGPKAYRKYVAVYQLGTFAPPLAPAPPAPDTGVDVDSPPAVKTNIDPDAFAVVIGVERYRQAGIPAVDYAARDAQTVYAYLTRAMGFDAKNVVLLTDEGATKTDFEKNLKSWLANRVGKRSRVFIYYAGHGAPNPATGEGYLMPYEADPNYLSDTAFPLSELYAAVAKLPTNNVTVVLDACFSGQGGRSLIAKGARPLVTTLREKTPENAIVLAAAQSSQISASDPARRHGLLTSYLLEGLHGAADTRGDGRITIAELFAYAAPAVERAARLQNIEQTPSLSGEPRPEALIILGK